MIDTCIQTVAKLGLGKVEEVLRSLDDEVTLTVGAPGSEAFKVVKFYRFGTGSPNAQNGDGLGGLAERWEHQNELASAAGGRFLLPYETAGVHGDLAYAVRRGCKFHLGRKLQAKRLDSSEDLFQIVNGIWLALAFLHQKSVGKAHGNLHLGNILFDPADARRGPSYFLTDAALPGSGRDKSAMDDFRKLGRIITQFCEGNVRPGGIELLSEPDCWPFLAQHRNGWVNLTRTLLDENTYRNNAFDAVSSREALLGPLKPKSGRIDPVPEPSKARSRGPAISQNLVLERLNRVRRLIADGHCTTAIPELCILLARATAGTPHGDTAMTLLNSAVAGLSEQADSPALEAAAAHSPVAAYRLAVQVAPFDPDRVFPLLKRAAPHLEALVAQPGGCPPQARYWLAVHLLHHGTAPSDPRLLALLKEAMEHVHDQQENAAVLLGQCLLELPANADNTARAQALFQQFARDPHARNNLAVCGLHGLGPAPVPSLQDVRSGRQVVEALHHLQQAALEGCTVAEQNLEALPPRYFLA